MLPYFDVTTIPMVYFGLGSMFILSLLYAVKQRNKLPLPPGPKPLPIVGNLFDMPSIRPWVAYSKWVEQYGSDILCLKLPFQIVIVLDSATAAFNLLEKRASIYSDKPLTVMHELVGWDWNIGVMQYGQRWRSIRRIFHQQFNAGAVHRYRDAQVREIAAYLQRELAANEATVRSLNHLFSAIILDIVYGMHIKDMSDPAITMNQESVVSFGEINVPGAFWVDSLPLLRYLPPWVPGTTFHKYAAIHRPKVLATRDGPFDTVKEDVARDLIKPSISHNLLKGLQERYGDASAYAEQEEHARDAIAVSYSAGVATSQATTSWFIIAMALFPRVQEKVQRELDRVIGPNRLPTHDDFASLPYLQATYLETLRWRPALPVGLPHRCIVEDEYKGYRIPKGSVIVFNTWKMCHDPDDYPNPDIFDPDRFMKDGELNPKVLDPSTIIFGFGRRICAGRHFAKEVILLTSASILSVFNIAPALDQNGIPVQIATDLPAGVLLHPQKLDCVFKPRSSRSGQLIHQSAQ